MSGLGLARISFQLVAPKFESCFYSAPDRIRGFFYTHYQLCCVENGDYYDASL